MRVTRWDPRTEVDTLRNHINRLFDESLGQPEPEEQPSSRSWTPPVDVKETDEALLFLVDLPGVDKEEIDLSLSNETLVITGVRQRPDEESASYHRTERPFGRYQRSFSLGTAVTPEAITASYCDGVLRLVLPKADSTKPKRITITGD